MSQPYEDANERDHSTDHTPDFVVCQVRRAFGRGISAAEIRVLRDRDDMVGSSQPIPTLCNVKDIVVRNRSAVDSPVQWHG
ncbi:hypothetical protein HMPREF3044_09190 [Corynebacterium sp. HMSC073D01]|nr:hypothetical protein HMPREF3044_09190 [Corynebacterium sp. HMSC073D01]